MTIMRHLSIDIETYSSVNIKKSGLYKYVQSPDFTILLLAYSWDGEKPCIIDLMQDGNAAELSIIIDALSDPNVVKHAYNAAFEWYCFNKFWGSPIDQWRCTMVHGLYCGFTAGLALTGEVLGLAQEKQKLSVGQSLIRTFCCPVKPTKANGQRTRILPIHEPEKWELFKEYCIQDVVTEIEVGRQLSAFPFPESEQKLWELDITINARGVGVDAGLVSSAVNMDCIVTNELTATAQEITGLENPNSLAQLTQWLAENGVTVDNLQKATVAQMAVDIESTKVKSMLNLRLELAKSSVSKYKAMNESLCKDGRIRGLIQFYGANRTGRWAGRLVQVHNLPRNYLGTLDIARNFVKRQNIEAVKLFYGDVPDTLSQLIRTAFVPSPGNVFLVADFSAIEARVIAWLAGEAWRQEVFATHGKIYEASAASMFGVPLERIKKGNPEYALRQKGKIAELALGYGGSSGALIQMGALNMGLTEEELPEIVHRWRGANKRIVDLWYGLENAALLCMRTGKQTAHKGIFFARETDYKHDFLTVQLPSGRKLYYSAPFLASNRWGKDSIHYYGVGNENKWSVQDTYGGKLAENIVQAMARDCLAVSIQRLEEVGFKIVIHVHDEVIIDHPADEDSEIALEKACNIMGESISWAEGLLLNAEGFVCQYYKKE